MENAENNFENRYSCDDQEKESFLLAPEFSYVKIVGRMVTDRKTQTW